MLKKVINILFTTTNGAQSAILLGSSSSNVMEPLSSHTTHGERVHFKTPAYILSACRSASVIVAARPYPGIAITMLFRSSMAFDPPVVIHRHYGNMPAHLLQTRRRQGSVAGHSHPPLGKKKVTTTKSKLIIKGKSVGSVTSVTYRIGKKGGYKKAKGTNSWHFAAKLKPGKNIITIIAHRPGGDSAPSKLIVIRK